LNSLGLVPFAILAILGNSINVIQTFTTTQNHAVVAGHTRAPKSQLTTPPQAKLRNMGCLCADTVPL